MLPYGMHVFLLHSSQGIHSRGLHVRHWSCIKFITSFFFFFFNFYCLQGLGNVGLMVLDQIYAVSHYLVKLRKFPSCAWGCILVFLLLFFCSYIDISSSVSLSNSPSAVSKYNNYYVLCLKIHHNCTYIALYNLFLQNIRLWAEYLCQLLGTLNQSTSDLRMQSVLILCSWPPKIWLFTLSNS